MPDPTSLVPNPAASIPGTVLGLAQTVTSLVNAGKAKKEAKELERTRPKREISPMYGKNLSLTESELEGGMSSAAEAAYNNLQNKQLSASLGAILRGGGSVNNVSDVFASGEEGRMRLSMLTDQLKLKQIDNVIKAREMMADETDKNFLFNDWAPWADKSQANAEAKKAANKGIWSGLSTMTGGLTNILQGSGEKKSSTGVDGEPLPDGQKMWEDWARQQTMDNSKQSIYELPEKYRTDNPAQKDWNVSMFDEGLYNFLNRGR